MPSFLATACKNPLMLPSNLLCPYLLYPTLILIYFGSIEKWDLKKKRNKIPSKKSNQTKNSRLSHVNINDT